MFKLLCQLEKAEVAKAFHYSCIFPKMKVINLNVFSWRKSLLLYNENLMLCGSTTMKNVPSALRFQCYYLDGFRSCKIKNMAALCCWMKTRDDQGEAAIKFVQNFAKNTKSIRAEKLQFQKLSRSSLSSKSENLAGPQEQERSFILSVGEDAYTTTLPFASASTSKSENCSTQNLNHNDKSQSRK